NPNNAVDGSADDLRRAHHRLGLLPRLRGRAFGEAAVDQSDGGRDFRIVGGELKSDAGAPRMPGDDRALEPERFDERCEVAGCLGEGIRAGLVAEAVAPLVEGDGGEVLSEQRGSE